MKIEYSECLKINDEVVHHAEIVTVIPRSLMPVRRPQFVVQFWSELLRRYVRKPFQDIAEARKFAMQTNGKVFRECV